MHGKRRQRLRRTMQLRQVHRSGHCTTRGFRAAASRWRSWSTEEPEIARFAASLVRVEYNKEAHVTDLYRQRAAACGAWKCPQTRARTGLPLCRAARPSRRSPRPPAPQRRVLRPDRASQPNGALRLDGDLRGRRQADDLRQDPGRPERSALCLQRARHRAGRCTGAVAICGWRLRFRVTPAISGGSGRAGGARAEALCAPCANAAADVRAGLPARHDPANRVGRKRHRNTRCDRAPGDHGDFTVRGFPSARDRLVRPALQMRQRAI